MLTRVRLSVLVLVAAFPGILGAFPGFAPTSAEPGGLFVYCGRALFGRPSTLPNPACSGAYAPVDTIAVLALCSAGVLLLLALGLVVHRARTAGRGESPGT